MPQVWRSCTQSSAVAREPINFYSGFIKQSSVDVFFHPKRSREVSHRKNHKHVEFARNGDHNARTYREKPQWQQVHAESTHPATLNCGTGIAGMSKQ